MNFSGVQPLEWSLWGPHTALSFFLELKSEFLFKIKGETYTTGGPRGYPTYSAPARGPAMFGGKFFTCNLIEEESTLGVQLPVKKLKSHAKIPTLQFVLESF